MAFPKACIVVNLLRDCWIGSLVFQRVPGSLVVLAMCLYMIKLMSAICSWAQGVRRCKQDAVVQERQFLPASQNFFASAAVSCTSAELYTSLLLQEPQLWRHVLQVQP